MEVWKGCFYGVIGSVPFWIGIYFFVRWVLN